MEAQSLRLEGDIDGSIALLRVVVSHCVDDANREGHHASNELHLKIWQMASYQLALLLLQKSGRSRDVTASEVEADTILSKMGYRSRLSVKAFGYPTCDCTIGKSSQSKKTSVPLLVIDDALPQSIFDALRHSLRPCSRYWTEFYVKTACNDDEDRHRVFASHNIPLNSTNRLTSMQLIENSSSLIEQIAIIVKHRLSHRFPSIMAATSVEVWSHRRPPDAHHQLHYDMDEIALWKYKQRKLDGHDSDKQNGRGNKRQKIDHCTEDEESEQVEDCTSSVVNRDLCPIVSCVLTVNVPNETKSCEKCNKLGDGAPTLVCNQHLLGNKTNEGWLCYPRLNRLVAFDGSLLHGVLPGIPIPARDTSADEDNHRVTLMLGFWKDVTLTVADDNASKTYTIGPNVPLPASLLDEFKPVVVGESLRSSYMNVSVNHVKDPILISPLWEDFSNEQAVDLDELHVRNSEFKGRFFRKTSDNDIDKEILGYF